MKNEDNKDFNAKMRDSKDMPKIEIITDPKTIERYGGMYDVVFSTPFAQYWRSLFPRPRLTEKLFRM